MFAEQYSHERLEWNEQHSAKAEIVVSIVAVAATFLAFCLVL